MSVPDWPAAWSAAAGRARIRVHAEDFDVREELGFEPSGSGEHVFLSLEKRGLDTLDVVQRLRRLSGVSQRDIGYSGLKDRNAVTQQWFSLGMAGRSDPNWQALEAEGDISVIHCTRHNRKLRRGVHRGNRFRLRLRSLEGDTDVLAQRLVDVQRKGVPNYFGPQRFGRNGSTLSQALSWAEGARRQPNRADRGRYLSVLRALLFNTVLAARVKAGTWEQPVSGDICMLHGSRSFFGCEEVDEELILRAGKGDIHVGLPLWGGAVSGAAQQASAAAAIYLIPYVHLCRFLEQQEMALAWRPARMLADDFCWQFCDHGVLQLDFFLGAGSYATALLAEIVQYGQG
ncbi:MAG: tRNA pseudouridine(13) synthase TruD [Pseudomonadota bacterium]